MNGPRIHLVRHGETAWSRSGQHTGRTDLPLTPRGREHALALRDRLRTIAPSYVFTSPLERARHTCELAGFGAVAVVDPDLVEWDYGRFEGLRTLEIQQRVPHWELYSSGAPDGESPDEVARRVDRVIARWRALAAPVLAFSSGHVLRALAARWLGQPVATGARLLLDTASLSELGYAHSLAEPAIRVWNDTHHLAAPVAA